MAEEKKETPRIEFRPGGGRRGPNMKAEKPKNSKATLRRLIGYIGKSRITVILIVTLTVFASLMELLGPMLQQQAIDSFQYKDPVTGEVYNSMADASEGKTEAEKTRIKLIVGFENLTKFLILLVAFNVFSAAVSLVMSRMGAKLAQSTVYFMRKELFEKISRLPIRYTDTHKHGDIMSRMTNDVENVSNAISSTLTTLVSTVLTIVGSLIMMLRYSWIMTLVAIVTIPLTVLVSTTLSKFMRKYYVRNQKLLGQLNGQVEEMVTGYRTVVAYGKEPEAVEKFGGISDEYRKCSIKARVWGSVMGPVMNFIGNLQYVLVAATGGYLVIRGGFGMTPGVIQAMLQYSQHFSRPINMLANQYAQILTALAGAERIFEMLDSPDEEDKGKNVLPVEDIRGHIEFRDVDFGYYPGEPVLKKLNLTVEPGQKVAIVGATGSGKTTIVNLLTRFYNIEGGAITVDGVDINDLPLETLRNAIAIVLQDTVLFSDSIRKNLKYGKPEASDEDMKKAAHSAKADSFIDRLPEGYDTQLTESGSNLSQGQRQLLSIARAVLADPRILILDEATSSVDTRTEMHIQQAMVALMKNRTSLIIAHRLSTIRDADKIVVLKDGVIAESGSHEELLEAGGEYYKLYSSQFAGVAT